MKILKFLLLPCLILVSGWFYLNISVFFKIFYPNTIVRLLILLPVFVSVIGAVSFIGFKKVWGRQVAIYCYVYFIILDILKYIAEPGAFNPQSTPSAWIYFGFTALNAALVIMLVKMKNLEK